MRGFLALPVLIVLAALALGGCTAKDTFGRSSDKWKEQDFKPYIGGEQYAFPTAYGTESWAYPEGTSTEEIVARWKQAGLIKTVTTGGFYGVYRTPRDTVTVFVGPNFYNLSDSSRRGFADAVGKMYGVGQNGRTSYLLYDGISKKPIGTYNLNEGLYTY